MSVFGMEMLNSCSRSGVVYAVLLHGNVEWIFSGVRDVYQAVNINILN